MALRGWTYFATLALVVSTGCQPAPDASRGSIRFHIEVLLRQPFPAAVWKARDAERLFSELAELYQARDFEPLWVRESRLSEQGAAVLDVLYRAPEHGLRRSDYLVRVLAPESFPPNFAASSAETKAHVDISLSFATMRYIKDVHEGRLSPRELELGLDIMHDHKDLATEIEPIAVAVDAENALDAFAPSYPQYDELKSALELYRRLAETYSWRRMKSNETIQPGEIYDDVDILRQRLRRTGDLLENDVSEGRSYDPVLVAAVKRFQHRHSLNTEGVLGPRTFADLNTTWSDRVAQIVASMERWRWIPEHTNETHLIANIPEYQLRAVTPTGDVEFISRLIVGQTYNHLRTPIFFGELRYIDFRPYWNVPLSIIERELSESLDEPGYFEKHRYEIVASTNLEAQALPVSAETIAKVRTGALRLRQKPGPGNALGLVKFIFPNEHSVFLHSTPARYLFRREERAFSHGCVRVEDAARLAEWVLEGQDDWNRETIRDAMVAGPTTRVFVERDVPVYILYLTAFVEPVVGDLHFGHDIYGLDAELAHALGY